MLNAEKPIYLVALNDKFIGTPSDPLDSLPSFGTYEAAEKFARETARGEGLPTSLFRVVRYDFAGDVREVSP